MKQSEWLQKAKKLHKECCLEQSIGNGSKKTTDFEATVLNKLQHAIGSRHGIHTVTYNEARKSLDEMFDMVKSGGKKPLFSKE